MTAKAVEKIVVIASQVALRKLATPVSAPTMKSRMNRKVESTTFRKVSKWV